MKKILLSIFTFLGFAASTQTLTYSNNSPAWFNSTYQIAQCDSTGITAGISGAGATWTFPINHPLSAKTYTTSNTVPGNTLYPTANVSVYSSASDVSYYNSNVNRLLYYGGNILINSYALTIVYASPATFATYPMSLNTTTTSITSGTINLTNPFPVSQAFTGTCSVIADGTGTLTLPAKTFTDVIRVATSQTIVAAAATVYQLTYNYYSPGASKAPIFSIQTSTINVATQPTSTQTVTYVQPNYSVVSVNEVQNSAIELSVYPNPASNIINFSTSSTEAVKITALDITGKVVASEIMEMGVTKMNITNLSSGIYIYNVLNKNNQILKSGKFNVSK